MKNNKAITLLALVVTIVVILILAAITLNMVLGKNGILEKAKDGKKQMDIARAKEKIDMAILEIAGEKQEKEGTSPSLDEVFDKLPEKLPGAIGEIQEESNKKGIVITQDDFIAELTQKEDMGIETEMIETTKNVVPQIQLKMKSKEELSNKAIIQVIAKERIHGVASTELIGGEKRSYQGANKIVIEEYEVRASGIYQFKVIGKETGKEAIAEIDVTNVDGEKPTATAILDYSDGDSVYAGIEKELQTNNENNKLQIIIKAQDNTEVKQIMMPDGTIKQGSTAIFKPETMEMEKEYTFLIEDIVGNILEYKVKINQTKQEYIANTQSENIKEQGINVEPGDCDVLDMELDFVAHNKDQVPGPVYPVDMCLNYEIRIYRGEWIDRGFPQYGPQYGDYEYALGKYSRKTLKEVKEYIGHSPESIYKDGCLYGYARAVKFPNYSMKELQQKVSLTATVTRYKLIEIK